MTAENVRTWRKRFALVIESIVYGTLGALSFGWIGIPAGLISGAMLAVAIAALAGRPVPFPKLLGQASAWPRQKSR